jgi:hypothetical protein
LFEEHAENLKRLLLQPDFSAVLKKLSGAEINFKRPEAGMPHEPKGIGHKDYSMCVRVYHSK